MSTSPDPRRDEPTALRRAQAALAAAGLGPVPVDRCPAADCPLCRRADRAAA